MEGDGIKAMIVSSSIGITLLVVPAMLLGMLLMLLLGVAGGTTPEMPPTALLFCRESFSWPLVGYDTDAVTSGFGLRSSPGGIGSTDHKGIDIKAPTGTKIHAVCEGTVTKAAFNRIRGFYVEVDHGGGITTLYQHMSEIKCKTGDAVSQGDVIGLVGSTGNSTGAHLHFEVRVDGTCYDPLSVYFIDEGGG